MINHHPNTNILSEYAAGSLDLAQSIAVSAHLHFCHQCRKQVDALEDLGGALFAKLESAQLENIETVKVSDEVFDAVMQKLDNNQPEPKAKTVEPKHPSLAGLPPIIASLIGKKSALNWKKLTKSLQIAPLRTGQHSYEVSLHKISAGGKVLPHDHRGLEYTLVLKGSFSDEEGVYQKGDFLIKKPGEEHAPYAAANRDCICLTVVEAPVRFTGLFSRFLNPFLRLQPQ